MSLGESRLAVLAGAIAFAVMGGLGVTVQVTETLIDGAAASELLEDIRIDLSTFQGSTARNWNNISNLTGLTAGLIDFNTGAATTVSIDGTGSPWADFFGDDAGEFPNQDWLIQPATVDGAGLQADLTGSFRVAGLTGAAYQIEVVSARTSFDYQNTFTVDGALADRTFLGTPVNTPWGSTSDGLTPGNWLIWDNVAPVNGELTITDVSGPGTLGIFNALRIVEIPAGDADGDGVPDDEDACPESNLSETIVIDECDSGVENMLFEDGCTMADLIAGCADGASNHGAFVSCVAHLTNEWKAAGFITGQEEGAIQSCAARSNIPGDLDGDGAVGVADLVILLGAWGPCRAHPDACPADVDLDDIVGITDLLILLGNWG